MSRLRKRHHLNVDVRKKGYIFSKCYLCESLKDLISKLGRNNNDTREYELKLKKCLLHQESCRSLYHTWRFEFVQFKDEFLCFIHDKMDHAKTTFLMLQMAKKMICGLGQLPITLMGMIAHSHGNERYAQYSNKLWPNDPNFIIASLLRFFQTLEKALACESKMLFEHPPQNALFAHLLQGKSDCITKVKTPSESVGPKPLPKHFILQMDNCVKDNKNKIFVNIFFIVDG